MKQKKPNPYAVALKDLRYRKRVVKSKKVYDRKKVRNEHNPT